MISREPTIERLATAQSLLLTPFGLTEAHLSRALAEITAHKVDDADLYFQYTRSEGWSLEEGIVKTGSFSIDQGVGVRAVAGEKTAFAYSDDISEASLLDAARTVRTISTAAQNRRVKAPARKVATSRSLYGGLDPIATLDSTPRSSCWSRVEKLARAKDPRIVQVMAGLASEYDVVLVARADGTLAADVRPLVRLSVTVIAEQNGRREMGSGGGGGRFGLAYFTDAQIAEYVDDAVKAALTNLDARPAPAGEMTVVLGPGWPGMLLHEAIGHGLEGDFNRKGSSAFSGPHRPARGGQGRDGARRRHHRRPPRLAQRGRRRPRQPAQRADRGRHPEGLHPGLDERAPDGRQAHRQRPARKLRPRADAAHDQHLHARRRQGPEGRSSPASRRACTPPTSAAARSTSPRQVRVLAPARPSGWRTARSSTR